jgi:transposase
MSLAARLISKELYKVAKNHLKTLNQDNRAAIRLRAIISTYEHGVDIVAKVYGVSGNTIRNWVKSFSKDQVSGLQYKPGRGRKSKLIDCSLQAIAEWIRGEPNLTIAAILQRLEKDHGVESSKSAVHRALHKLKLSYITPRPIHYKQDKNLGIEFKKKST